MPIELKKFNINFDKNDRVFYIIGKGEGEGEKKGKKNNKHKLTENILYYFNHSEHKTNVYQEDNSNIIYNNNLIVTDNNDTFAFYKLGLFFITNCSHSSKISDISNKVKNINKYVFMENNKLHDGFSSKNINCKKINGFVILDNCFKQHTLFTSRNDKHIKQLIIDSKISNNLIIINCDNYMDINPSVKTYIDYVFIFYENDKNELENIYLEWCSFLCTFVEFCELIERYTSNGGCLVISKAYILHPSFVSINKQHITIENLMYNISFE